MKLTRSNACLLVACAVLTATAEAQNGLTVRASTSVTGGDANGHSVSPSMSDDGRYVAFASNADDLLPPGTDTNSSWDVFVLDRQNGSIRRVSVVSGGGEAGGDSGQPSISADGSRVAFTSDAWNLVNGDNNNYHDVFVVDVATLVVRRVSVSSTGVEGNGTSWLPAISGDGRRVAFESYAGTLSPMDGLLNVDVYWHDIASGVTRLVSRTPGGPTGNGDSIGDSHDGPSISFDGNLVAFCSESSNLVPNDTNAYVGPQSCTWCGIDVFVHNLTTFVTTRVSVTSGGAESDGASMHPSISGNGRWVAFASRSMNLVANDTNQATDIFLHDRDPDLNGIFDEPGAIETRRVSVSATGAQGDKHSGGGGFFWRGPELSRDGRRVAFTSSCTNLVPGDTNGRWDLFVRDLEAGTLTCASVTPSGATGDFHSYAASFSADGSRMAFESQASDLVSGDTNQLNDVFVRTECAPPRTYCTAKVNSLGCTPSISTSGVASGSLPGPFEIRAANLRNHVIGGLVFTINGPKIAPFMGGLLCLRPPIVRTPVLASDGSPTGYDCSGAFAFDFNAYLRTGVHPAITDGRQVWAQFWSRDPGDAFGLGLTDAVSFTLCAQ